MHTIEDAREVIWAIAAEYDRIPKIKDVDVNKKNEFTYHVNFKNHNFSIVHKDSIENYLHPGGSGIDKENEKNRWKEEIRQQLENLQ
ncbi:MAG: hypothetical protein WBD04_06540 [Candidatus Omnitrophota bacterium]